MKICLINGDNEQRIVRRKASEKIRGKKNRGKIEEEGY